MSAPENNKTLSTNNELPGILPRSTFRYDSCFRYDYDGDDSGLWALKEEKTHPGESMALVVWSSAAVIREQSAASKERIKHPKQKKVRRAKKLKHK